MRENRSHLESVNLKNIDDWLRIGAFSAFLVFTLGLFSTTNVADPDLWGYLSFGRLFWHSQKFPYHDVFSYVPTRNLWVYHEWLTGVLFYPLYQTLGAPGLLVLKYGLGLATIGLIYLTARRRGAHPLAAALFAVIILEEARYGYGPVRAQVFTYFFFALTLYLLERARLTGWWQGLYFLPLILIPWANLHGGFLAGLGLMVIYAGGEFLARRPFLPYLLIFFLSLLVTLVNPYGVEYWAYVARAVTMPRPTITEWASIIRGYQTGVVNEILIIYLLILSFVGLWGMWRSHWREVSASLALAVTLVLSLWHIRHLPFFVLLAGAYWPVCLQVNVDYLQSRPALQRLGSLRPTKISVLAGLAMFTILNLVFFVGSNPLSPKLPEKPGSPKEIFVFFYPVGAVNFILEHGLTGKILTVFQWGEYLIWELYPRCLVAYDGRYETVYPPEVDRRYIEFYYARPQWRRFLEDYPPDLILLDQRMETVKFIQKEPQWRQVYADSGCALFVADQK